MHNLAWGKASQSQGTWATSGTGSLPVWDIGDEGGSGEHGSRYGREQTSEQQIRQEA